METINMKMNSDNKKEGLNRTMQYGNFTQENLLPKVILCLNRTMQYGNSNGLFEPCFTPQGLNRTMQYGNLGRYKIEAMADAV